MKIKHCLFAFLFLLNIVNVKGQTSCNNEDFEASPTGAITTTNGVTGWTLTGGTNNSPGGSCSFSNCCVTAPTTATLISTTSGFIDPSIGPTYPIYSVFGSIPNAGGMFGDKIIRLNDATPGGTAHRLSKTINVTTSNNYFQFAFITIAAGGHPCCDAPLSNYRLINISTGSVIPCPQLTDNYPATGCTGLGMGTYTTCPMAGGLAYHKWKIMAFDLSAYIGTSVIFEMNVVDCNTFGHAGYSYFDAQCGPLGLSANSTFFGFSGPAFTLPTCGAGSSATITAPAGLGPYSWTGPGGFVPTSSPTMTTNITGNYTLTMTPPGSCVPIVWTASLVISPAPFLSPTSSSNPLCLGNSATLSANPSSGTPPYTYSWSSGATSSIAVISPTASTTYTAYITDNVGCINTNTIMQNVTSCVGINSINADTKNSVLFPNPNNGDFVISIENQINEGELILKNILGQTVFKQSVKQGNNSVKTEGLAKGIYSYSILQNKKVISTGKLVIE